MNNTHQYSEGPYQILEQIIGKGSFGVVKLGLNRNNGKLVAIKTESKTGRSLLKHENNIIRSCQQACPSRGRLCSRYFWEDKDNYYLVLDLMGPSIDSLHKLCSRSFSLKTTLMLASQMLDLLQFYHINDIIHRDIKPSNFLINYSIPHTHVCLIDFGLAKKYKIKGKQIPFAFGAAQVGSLRYMSKHIHSSIEPSRRDDLYSLGYCIIFMFTGLLPWQEEHIAKMTERKQYVGKLKRETSNTDLVHNCKCLDCKTPSPGLGLDPGCSFQRTMLEYFNYLDSLDYESDIDYKVLSFGLGECMKSHGLINDSHWDWDKYYIISSVSIGI
jgi:serine/threonine protein kinase